MTDNTNQTGNTPFTHTAYFFIKTGMRKGRVYGYWKDGGRFRPQGEGNFFAFADMLPRGGMGRTDSVCKIRRSATRE